MKSYQETVDWLFSQLPVYQRTGPGSNYKIDLTKTHQLMELLGNPQSSFKSVHVAGTNGKGSVSHMLASILQEAGYKVGLYTSPHLKDFRERVRINGEMISKEEVIRFVNEFQSDFVHLQLSFFEMTVGLAFHSFRTHQVDVAIVEVGMGGRLDSTNVIVPEVSVITNIGLDHMAFLGDSIEKIAVEKAGIIKAGVPVVIGERQPETTEVFTSIARERQSPIHWAEDSIHTSYESDLAGFYQKNNIRTAVAALKTQKTFTVQEEHIKSGLLKVIENTQLLGRWQKLGESPTIIADTGHNEPGLQYILQQIESTPHSQLHIVWGMVNDKDIHSVLSLLPKNAMYYFCRPSIPRGLEVQTLHQHAKECGLKGNAFSSVMDALNEARRQSQSEDLIFVGGSTFVVAEVV